VDGLDALDAADGADAVHADGLGLVSTRTVMAFLVGFGWTGAIARGGGLSLAVSVLIGLAVGFLLMLAVFWFMRGLYSLRQSGSLDYRNAVGELGTVYVTIPPAGTGSGQIQVVVQGRLSTVAASTTAVAAIPSGTQVKVVKLLAGNTLQVETI
jgi:NhaP-type Na+/H+ or K+/H+ antiporter